MLDFGVNLIVGSLLFHFWIHFSLVPV